MEQEIEFGERVELHDTNYRQRTVGDLQGTARGGVYGTYTLKVGREMFRSEGKLRRIKKEV